MHALIQFDFTLTRNISRYYFRIFVLIIKESAISQVLSTHLFKVDVEISADLADIVDETEAF